MARQWTVVRPSPVHAWGAAIVVDGVLIAEMAAEDAAEAARCVNAHDALVAALEGLLARYVSLVNSGDAGSWDPQTDQEVEVARAALRAAKGEE